MNLEVLTPILAGAALSAPYLLLARAWPAAAPRIYAIGLVVAAGIYGVLAVVAGDFGALPLEIGGLLVFTLVAVAGLRWWQPLLALGWAAMWRGTWRSIRSRPAATHPAGIRCSVSDSTSSWPAGSRHHRAAGSDATAPP